MIKLYGMPLSFNVNKVRYCLNHLELKYEWIQTNPLQEETRAPAFIDAFPTGKIPALEVDGLKLFESNAINRYLAATHSSSLYPQDAKKRVFVDAWMDYVAIHVGHALGRVLFNRVLAPMNGTPVDKVSLQTGLEFLDKYFPILEKQLSKNTYLAGADLSLADLNLLAVLDPCELADISLTPYPRLTKWRNEMKNQKFYQQCYKDYTQFIKELMSAKK